MCPCYICGSNPHLDVGLLNLDQKLAVFRIGDMENGVALSMANVFAMLCECK